MAGLLLGLVAWLCRVPAEAASAPPSMTAWALPTPRLAWESVPEPVVPGAALRLRLAWDLPSEGEPEPEPRTDLPGAQVTWSTPRREDGAVHWDGTLVPWQTGALRGTVTLQALVPELPTELPQRSEAVALPPRVLTLFYAPCRYARVSATADLPALMVRPWPTLPPGSPPFINLVGSWRATLSAEPQAVRLGQPVVAALTLTGDGATDLLQPPPWERPEFEISEPQSAPLVAGPGVRLTWTLRPRRLPLTPVTLRFGTLAGTSYVVHDLTLPLRVLPDPLPAGPSTDLPPGLLTFHPLRPGRRDEGPRHLLLASVVLAGVGLGLGGGLWALAGRRDARQQPAARRRRALRRLHGMRSPDLAQLPQLHADLRLVLGLPPEAAPEEITVALAARYPELAAELRALESARFAPPGSPPPEPQRLLPWLRRLSLFAVLAGNLVGLPGLAATTHDPAGAAATAFQHHDLVALQRHLDAWQQAYGESPELLMNRAHAAWFGGGRIEALGAYERALRLAPRQAAARAGVAWLQGELLAGDRRRVGSYPLPVRDRLRPEEWLALAALILGSFSLGLGWRRWQRRTGGRWAAELALGLVVLCLAMALSQWAGPYRSGAHARLTESAALLSAPDAAALPLGGPHAAGTPVVPLEAHGDWHRVRQGEAAGWVRAAHLVIVW